MLNSTLKVNSVIEFIDTIIKHPNFIYARGESKAYDKPFLPSIWRPSYAHLDKTTVNDKSTFTLGELDLLKQFQKKVISGEIKDPYFPTFIGDINQEITIESENLLHWTAFAQHYQTPTRLVDVTADCLTALYFACERNFEENGYVHIFRDGYNLVNKSNFELVTFGGSFFDIQEIRDNPGDVRPKLPQSNTTSVLIPSFPNRRIEAQKGAFCLTRDNNIPAYWGGQLTIEIISKDGNKKRILDHLNKLGYNSETIYPPEF